MDAQPALALNLLLRGGTIALLLLVAAALWRDHRGHLVARLGAAFAIGVAAATLTATPGFVKSPDLWHAVVAAIASTSMFAFWLFTCALLSDDFKARNWHVVVWIAMGVAGALSCFLTRTHPAAIALGWFMTLMPVAWSLLAIAQSIATWREDLVEGRRRLRTLIVATTAIYTVAQLVAALAFREDMRQVVGSTANALGTAALTLFLVLRMTQVRMSELLAPALSSMTASTLPPEPTTQATATATATVAPDARQLATLERLMTAERIYREPSLTIAALALRMGLPEHRVRKLINQALGHRNFNAFLNAWRIEDAKRALRDPAQADVPVLTIAMDIGFQSIGPFNRAFKAATGVTPTAYRLRPAHELTRRS